MMHGWTPKARMRIENYINRSDNVRTVFFMRNFVRYLAGISVPMSNRTYIPILEVST